MDKPPSNYFSLFSRFLKSLSGICLTVISVFIFFSCSNTAPEISKVNAKVVYDFENEKDKPVQKLSLFLEMKSEVRRIEQINVYHKDTGYRWVITNPAIFETGSNQFAGYSNCQIAGFLNDIPKGEYQVCYLDSQGRETYTQFEITKNENSISNLSKLKQYLGLENVQVWLACYDEDSKLLSYSNPDADFEINPASITYNGDKIFTKYKKAVYFRLMFEKDDKIYITPKVYKDSKTEEKVKKD
ncbi:MAG: hypothetical protein KBS84_04125 [Treponema sp.]|nr:hypothetical protein [Candidatus Treponema scatequi]